jgi:hypothetical protein
VHSSEPEPEEVYQQTAAKMILAKYVNAKS